MKRSRLALLVSKRNVQETAHINRLRNTEYYFYEGTVT